MRIQWLKWEDRGEDERRPRWRRHPNVAKWRLTTSCNVEGTRRRADGRRSRSSSLASIPANYEKEREPQQSICATGDRWNNNKVPTAKNINFFVFILPEISKLVLDRLHIEMMRLFKGVRLDTTDKMWVLGPEASHQGYDSDFELSAGGGRTP